MEKKPGMFSSKTLISFRLEKDMDILWTTPLTFTLRRKSNTTLRGPSETWCVSAQLATLDINHTAYANNFSYLLSMYNSSI